MIPAQPVDVDRRQQGLRVGPLAVVKKREGIAEELAIEGTAPFIVERVLAADKPGTAIKWLTGRKAAWRFATSWATGRKVLPD